MNKDFIFLVMLGASALLAVVCFWLECRLRLARRARYRADADLEDYRQRLAETEKRLARVLGRKERPAATAETRKSQVFPGALQQAGLRLRLQQGQGRAAGVTERYRLVNGMVRRGLSAEDIGAILKISGSETEQLIKLSRVGRPADRSDGTAFGL